MRARVFEELLQCNGNWSISGKVACCSALHLGYCSSQNICISCMFGVHTRVVGINVCLGGLKKFTVGSPPAYRIRNNRSDEVAG